MPRKVVGESTYKPTAKDLADAEAMIRGNSNQEDSDEDVDDKIDKKSEFLSAKLQPQGQTENVEKESCGDEQTLASRPKRDFLEEWYVLQSMFMQWRDKEPEKHILYTKAVSMIASNKSLEYYEGVYHTLCALHPIIELVLKPGFSKDPQSAMTEILQLQIGYVIGKILEKWPKDLLPRITEKGAVRAQRSEFKDK